MRVTPRRSRINNVFSRSRSSIDFAWYLPRQARAQSIDKTTAKRMGWNALSVAAVIPSIVLTAGLLPPALTLDIVNAVVGSTLRVLRYTRNEGFNLMKNGVLGFATPTLIVALAFIPFYVADKVLRGIDSIIGLAKRVITCANNVDSDVTLTNSRRGDPAFADVGLTDPSRPAAADLEAEQDQDWGPWVSPIAPKHAASCNNCSGVLGRIATAFGCCNPAPTAEPARETAASQEYRV